MRLRNERCDMRHVSAGVMTVYEFWDRLRTLGWKYREKDGSPVRRRLRRIREWAVALLADSQPMDGVPLWLYNELKHVEEGREVGRCPGGIPNETPFLADILFHGILGDEPWWEGNTVLPSNFIMKKTSAKDGRAQNSRAERRADEMV